MNPPAPANSLPLDAPPRYQAVMRHSDFPEFTVSEGETGVTRLMDSPNRRCHQVGELAGRCQDR